MRKIKYIMLHCTGSHLDSNHLSIIEWFIDRHNFKYPRPPYHIMISQSGVIHRPHPIEDISYGCRGCNSNSIHVATIGGLVYDDRTHLQKEAMYRVVKELVDKFPDAVVIGHRDRPNVRRLCPRYDAAEWWANQELLNNALK